MTRKIAYILATGLGSGFTPLIPGTVGSLVALIIFYLLPSSLPLHLTLITMTYFAGVWASGIVEKDRGQDPGIVVIDEFAGQWIALVLLPLNIKIYLGAFILFRLFDILKPFPVRQMEKLTLGWGIMTDDVLAGIYANLIIQIALIIF